MSIRRTLSILPVVGMLALATPVAASAQRPAQVAPQATFGNLISALNNVSVQINKLNALNGLTVSQVRVVNVSDLLNGNNVTALNNALNKNNVQIVAPIGVTAAVGVLGTAVAATGQSLGNQTQRQ